MKRAIRAGLLAACATMTACVNNMEALRADDNTDFQSSGAASGDEVLGFMAVSVNPVFTPDEGDAGNESPEARQFTDSFARRFMLEFPARLRDQAVSVGSPGRGVPLLSVSVSGYRRPCQTQADPCKPFALLKGKVLDSSGKRIWSFTDWVLIEYMNDGGYEAFYRQLLKAMVKDQVIPKE